MSIMNKTNENFVEKKNTPKMKSREEDGLVWTKNELQLLETTRDFKAKKAYEPVNLECVKDK